MPDNVKTVATVSKVQESVIARAALPRTLAGGTATMRAAGDLYLPKEPGETGPAYEVRRKRSTLFNAFGRTVDDMTGKVFDKPVDIKENVPDRIKQFLENVDLTGQHLNVFMHAAFRDAMVPGIGYFLVDMPPKNEGVRTIADEKATGARPYVIYVPLERLLGWKSETVAGVETLTQVRIAESVYEDDGRFDVKEVEQVRVLEPGKWETWRKSKDEQWALHASGDSTLNKIALVPLYTHRSGFMTGSPPLEKLAELNVAHWQSSSDQRHILHFARVPQIYAMGFSSEAEITIGPNTLIRSDDPNAKVGVIEHSGAAIGAGRDDLKDLEFQMQVMGLQLLMPQPGSKTATGEAREDSKENSQLAAMANGLGDAIEQVLGLMAEYIGLGTDAGGEVEVNTDFGIKAGAMQDVPQIVAARSAGVISRDTAWDELKRRGFLSDSFDPEVEASRLDAEAPELDSNNPLDLDE